LNPSPFGRRAGMRVEIRENLTVLVGIPATLSTLS
jgi:hypothetical protein